MIRTLFKRRPKVAAPIAPSTPGGTIVWAVGDIHGRLDLLKPLVDVILADAEQSVAERKLVVFLGDYIDRGPDSRGVIRYLLDLPRDRGVEWRFLKGNHEEAMLDFLADPAAGGKWCEYGGDAALRSFGLSPPHLRHKPEAWARLSADLGHNLTPVERSFLENLELSVTVGDYFLVHAGARPGVPLKDQTPRDLMWIRDTFLASDVEFEKFIVHGHTPTRDVHVDRRRIGLDTKAYGSGRLTAVRLAGPERLALQTEIGEADGVVRVRARTLG